MCGIVGIFHPSGLPRQAEGHLTTMRDRLSHRGPDGAGLWFDADAGIGLGHRRLSIIDLSPAGHQPMTSVSGRYCIAFNGEIYNHMDLRARADSTGGSPWRGHSDTESLLAHIEHFGLECTLKEAVGMFALALWDRQTRTLQLARDRMGEKPLFYGWQGGVLLVGSELKALRAHPAFEAHLDPEAIPGYLCSGYIAAPRTVWAGVQKLPPGTLLSFRPDRVGLLPAPTPYWSFKDAALRGQSDPFGGTDDEAVDGLETVLDHAIAGQMVSDVPLGAFLSGGIDSSTTVALMQARSRHKVRTFSIGFREAGYDEAQYARAVAKHLGTDHTELYVTSDDARDVVPALPGMFDEPFGDSSAIPTFLVSRLARQHVTVALSGDGGDELFGGYNRYASTCRTFEATRQIPKPIMRAFSACASGAGSAASTLTERLPVMPAGLRQRLAVAALRAKLLEHVSSSSSLTEAYSWVVGQWQACLHSRRTGTAQPNTAQCQDLACLDQFHQLMAIDSQAYLPNDILTKVDRAAMAVSLETRIPLLDHRVVECAWRLPLHLKWRNGVGKWALRQVLARHVPPDLFERPKMGFGVPVGDWIRGPLRDWAEDLLSERALPSDGPLPAGPIRSGWQRHLRGDPGWRDRLWTVLMWQAWWASASSRAR
jgi:asparagine synthase (glutamine-hydrolysing)